MTITEQKIAALTKAAETSPEYASITPLFEAVYGYVSGRETQTGISIEVADSNREYRIGHGFPMISATDISFDRNSLIDFLCGAAGVLKRLGNDAGEQLECIASGLHEQTIIPDELVLAILERRRAPIDEAADRIGVPAPLIEYLFEIPLKTALERYASAVSPAWFDSWQEALCPVCGARPGMAELSGEEGRRSLCCSACFCRWPYKRLKCTSCGCEDVEKLSYFTAGDGSTRVDTCRACSRYIKTRDSRKGGADRPLEVEDLLTIHLDLLASREGFERGR